MLKGLKEKFAKKKKVETPVAKPEVKPQTTSEKMNELLKQKK